MTGGLKFSRRWFIGGAAWCRGLVCGTAIWSLCGLAHAAISDELAGALEPICGALAARRLAAPSGPAPEAADNSPAAIAYYLSKGLDGKLAAATVLTNDSAGEDKDVWLGDRMFRLPPKGWVAVSADGRAGSMNVRLNRQRFMAGWCDDYTVWVKDGKIGLRNLNLTRGVVVRAEGDPTRPRKPGEESAFAVEVRDEAGRLRTDGTVTVLADNCGAKKLLGETRFDLAAANPFTVRSKMDEPGFLRLTARLDKPAKSATATVPYAPEGIRPGTTRPDDFDAVWAADLRRAEATVPLDPRREEVVGAYGGALKEYSVSFATTEGRHVYGYMAVPKAASPTNKMGVVVTIVGAGPGASYAWDARDDSITLVLNVVDYQPTEANVGKDYAAMNAREKKRFGVDGYSQAGWTAKREEVFFHSQLIGLVRGLKWIAQLPEVDARDFTYFGGSQGGGCGMAVVALSDGLFRKAFLYITAMSDMLRADIGGRDGWPGVRRYASDADALAAVKRNAPYFDACSFARRVRCPVRSTLGLEDTTCPPPNVMASFNELASKDRKIDFEPRIGHGISGLRFASIYEWLRAKEDDEFRLAWTGRRIFDAELPFPDGATFLPHGHYRAEVRSLPASMRFADASGKTALEFAAPTNFAPPYVMHVGLSGRHNALVCVEQPNAAPKVADIVPMPLKTFDPSVQENLTRIRVKSVGGMGAVTMTQSAGLGQADVRFVTRGRECRPYVEDGRVFFTFSARYNSTHLGVGSIDPTRPEDGWRFEGTILFDYGDGWYANDVAAHLWLDDESGEWRAWTSNFSTAGRDADGKPVKRAPGGISVAVSKTSPLHGFSVMRSRTLGLSGMNEDPSGCWDARAKKWRLLVSAFTPNGIKAQMLESDRWDGGFKALTGTVPEDSTGTTIARMNGDFACLAGSVDRAYYVYSYPMLAKLGTLTMDKTPWGEKTGWPHGRGWPAYLEVEKGGVLHKLLLTMDRENYPGMPNPNWTYGALFLYRAGELVACPASGGSGEVVLQAKPAKGHLQDVCFDGKGSVYWAHTREIYKTDLSGRVLAKADVEGHHAGLEVRKGRLYVAVCPMQGTTGGKTTSDCRVTVGEYDAETLSLVKMHVTDINDRAGSLAILEDGTFLVGCLRPQDIAPSQVRFHHLDADFKLIKSHVLDNVPVELGIEVIKRVGSDFFLNCYGTDKDGKPLPFDTIRMDANFRETGRGKLGGAMGLVFDGDSVWTGWTRFDKATKTYTSKIVRKPRPAWMQHTSR